MKPLLRGYTHQAAFFIAIGAAIVLIYHSHGMLALISSIIYSVSLIGLYGISALYHSPMWGTRTYAMLKRIDHAAIFILIAGSATPICLLGLKDGLGVQLLTLIWLVAVVGIVISIFWRHESKWIRAVLYIGVGWIALPYLAEIAQALGPTNIELLIGGGVVYTVGALVYAVKWPNIFPQVFGYHELFHLFVIIASSMHFIVNYHLVTNS